MLKEDLKNRILILDGAMGTTLQKYNFEKEKVKYFEILNDTRPDIIEEIHKKYVIAGADIIETNTFNCNKILLKNTIWENRVLELAKKGGEIAKKVSKEFGEKLNRKIYVFGSIGPSNISLKNLLKLNKNENSKEFIDFKNSYKDEIKGLIEANVDALLVETIFDMFNAKAIILAIKEIFKEMRKKIPIFLSVTLDKTGTLFSGESIETFITELDNENIICFGINCVSEITNLLYLIERIKKTTNKYIMICPNRGIPNKNNIYTKSIETMKIELEILLKNTKINILGGCCGTNYEFIRSLKKILKD